MKKKTYKDGRIEITIPDAEKKFVKLGYQVVDIIGEATAMPLFWMENEDGEVVTIVVNDEVMAELNKAVQLITTYSGEGK